MKYKTLKDLFKPFVIFFLVLWIVMFALNILEMISNSDIYDGFPWLFMVGYFITVISLLIYSYSGDIVRNKYKKYGRRFDGYIESAKVYVSGRFGFRYVLKISFVDKKRMVRKTEQYMGNPNMKLSSRKCSIYELNGKYIETDFSIVPKKKEGLDLGIPILEK